MTTYAAHVARAQEFEMKLQYADAIREYRRATDVYKAGDLHLDSVISRLANLARYTMDYPLAITCYTHLLSAYKNAYGFEHERVKATLLKLGDTYDAMGELQKAMEQFTTVIDEFPGAFAKDFDTLFRIALIHYHQGRYTSAMEMYTRLVDEPDLSMTLRFQVRASMSKVFADRGKHREAVENMRYARNELLKRATGDEKHAFMVHIARAQSDFLFRANQLKEATIYAHQYLGISRLEPISKFDEGYAFHIIAQCMHAFKRYDDADRHVREALACFTSVVVPDHDLSRINKIRIRKYHCNRLLADIALDSGFKDHAMAEYTALLKSLHEHAKKHTYRGVERIAFDVIYRLFQSVETRERKTEMANAAMRLVVHDAVECVYSDVVREQHILEMIPFTEQRADIETFYMRMAEIQLNV